MTLIFIKTQTNRLAEKEWISDMQKYHYSNTGPLSLDFKNRRVRMKVAQQLLPNSTKNLEQKIPSWSEISLTLHEISQGIL